MKELKNESFGGAAKPAARFTPVPVGVAFFVAELALDVVPVGVEACLEEDGFPAVAVTGTDDVCLDEGCLPTLADTAMAGEEACLDPDCLLPAADLATEAASPAPSKLALMPYWFDKGCLTQDFA